MKNSETSTTEIDPALPTKLRARDIVKQEFGMLRSFAAIAKSSDQSIDEEALFANLAKAWGHGICSEMTSIIGIERTAEILDPWRHKQL